MILILVSTSIKDEYFIFRNKQKIFDMLCVLSFSDVLLEESLLIMTENNTHTHTNTYRCGTHLSLKTTIVGIAKEKLQFLMLSPKKYSRR
jgi:hypothetical protein